MNELPNQIKNLSYCLTILPVSSRCVENFARRHDLRQVIEKLNKALKKHRSSGYDIEGKKLPIENALLTILDRLNTLKLNQADTQKQCALLTPLEKNALLDLTQQIIDKMDDRESKAQAVLEAMSKTGITLDDLQDN